MGVNLLEHGYSEVAETDFAGKPTNDQHAPATPPQQIIHSDKKVDDSTPAQVAETSSVNSGEKKSPANTDENGMNLKNNSDLNSTTSPPKTQPANVVRLCDKQSRIAEAKKFFDTIFGNVTGEFYSYLWTLENHYTIPFRVSTEKARAAMAERAIKLSDSGKTVFFGVNCGSDSLNSNERYKANVPKNQKPDAPPIKLVTLQTVTITDIDIEGGTHKTDAKKAYAPDFDTAKSFLPFTASIVVNSGYGLHAYCIYREPIAVTDDNRKAVNKRNVDYIAAVRQRSGDCSKTADGVGDVSRVLRVPGTFNYKLGVKPDAPLCHVVDWNDIQFTADEMDSKLAEFFKQNAPQPQQEIFTPPPEIKIAPPPEPSRENFIGLDDDGPSEIERALAMLPYVDGGSYDTWYKVGFILKKIGCTFNDWASWSATQPNYQPDKPGYNMEYMWEHFPEENALNINTLHMWAQEGGYSEKDFQREWYSINRPNQPRKKSARKNILSNVETSQLADGDATQSEPIDPKVDEWEGINGKADPNLLKQLPEAVKTLEAITPENLTVEVALNSNTHACVALCQVYDWNASLAKKFFVTLDEAKKIAAAQVKSAKDNAGFVAEPTDEVKMLAELDKTEIKAAVKKIVSVITKRQANFAEKHAAKQAAQHRQQAIEEFKASLPTTKKILESCPVDLILPDNISFSANSIGLQFIDGNGNVRPQVAAISPAVVTKVFRENGTDELEYEVAILNRGRWKRKVVSATTLTTAREVGNLASIGLLAEDTKSLAKYFCRLLKANEETIPEITTYTRPGWHDGRFVYPGTTDADYRVRRSNIDYDSIFATHGDAQAWKKKFVEVTSSGGQICLKRIVVGACLAAPLLKVIKIPNFHLHVEGTSSFAKTPLPKLGLSVFGNPTEGGLLRGWNGTAKNRLTMAAGFCDLPQGLDELESLSKKDEESLAKNIYEFSLGIVNQANQRNGDVRPAEHFRSVRVSTGERGLLKDNDKQGAFKRALTLQVEQPLFSDDEARNLHCFLSENFGYFGRQWVEYIAKHQDEIKAHFEGICSYFTKSGFKRELDIVSVDTIDKTNFRDVVACAVAFHHFNLMLEANGAEFDAERAVLDAQEILATLPTVDDFSDLKRSTKLLASWIVENPTRFITPKLSSDNETSDNEPPPSLDELDRNDNPATSFAGTVGKIFPNGDVGFFQNAFRRIIEKDLGLPSYVKFLRDAYTENMLNCPSRREKTRKVTIDGRKISVYIFKASELFPADQAVDDPVAQYYDM